MNFFSAKKVHEKYLADFLLIKFFPDELSCDQLMFIYHKYTDDLRDESIYVALQGTVAN